MCGFGGFEGVLGWSGPVVESWGDLSGRSGDGLGEVSVGLGSWEFRGTKFVMKFGMAPRET